MAKRTWAERWADARWLGGQAVYVLAAAVLLAVGEVKATTRERANAMVSWIRGWSRRRKITVGAIGAVMMIGTGVAVAAILLRVPFTGSGNIQASPNIAVQSVNVTTEENADCTASSPTGSNVVLTFDGFTSGFCELTIGLTKTGGGTIVLQGFEFAGVTIDKIRATDCGRVIGVGSTTDVLVRVTANGTTGSFTVQPTDNAGLVAVDQASYQDVNCPKLL